MIGGNDYGNVSGDEWLPTSLEWLFASWLITSWLNVDGQ